MDVCTYMHMCVETRNQSQVNSWNNVSLSIDLHRISSYYFCFHFCILVWTVHKYVDKPGGLKLMSCSLFIESKAHWFYKSPEKLVIEIRSSILGTLRLLIGHHAFLVLMWALGFWILLFTLWQHCFTHWEISPEFFTLY